MNPWIQTASGQVFDLLHPTRESVVLSDIAYALSHINRFSGHAGAYSVAEHSVRVCRALAHEGHSAGVQRAGLMHDAHEAYIGDVTSPVKRAIGQAWGDLEERGETVVRQRFGISREMPKAVRDADLRMLLTERDALFGREAKPWGVQGEAYPREFGPYATVNGVVQCWTAQHAEAAFLAECSRLEIV